jgi:hypothetical protein
MTSVLPSNLTKGSERCNHVAQFNVRCCTGTYRTNNFGEFLRFFPGGLDPSKIRGKFISQKVVGFIFRILFQIGSLTNGESCSFSSYLSYLNFSWFLEARKVVFSIFETGHLNQFWINHLKIRKHFGPACEPRPAPTCARPCCATRLIAQLHCPITANSVG